MTHFFYSRIIFFILIFTWTQKALSISAYLQGQLSSCGILNTEESIPSHVGIRYIPTLNFGTSIHQKWTLDTEIALNGYGAMDFQSWDNYSTRDKTRLYRLWFRLSSSQFEARLGLQKINFGSAMMLRPLMWFDQLDPRDPLQITDGVYALLLRYFFVNNANIWLWGLYGNDETKGWEVVPSDQKAVELGGRFQYPIPGGELAVTYHYRKMNIRRGIQRLLSAYSVNIPDTFLNDYGTDLVPIPENRFGIDGKLDVKIGLWFEGVLVCQDIALIPQKYQRLMTIGADYTFGLGNGLHVLTEHLQFATLEKPFAQGEKIDISATALNYPMGLLDTISGIIYYDWKNHAWYRFINYQRTYNRWRIYCIGFWNPSEILLPQQQFHQNPFAGRGFQFMVVFNH